MKAYKGGLLKGVPMKYSNILVPYDHSESAKHAMFTALEFAAENPETHVTAFFASPVPEFESSGSSQRDGFRVPAFSRAGRISRIISITARVSQKSLIKVQNLLLISGSISPKSTVVARLSSISPG
ncbi:MAG: universal stress protein [Slackia sp.]